MIQHLRFATLFLIVCTLLLSACRNEPKATEQTTTEVQNNTLSVRLRAEPDRLNPTLTYRQWSLQVANQIFQLLMDHDPQTKKLTPILVKSLPVVRTIEEGPFKGGTAYDYEMLEEAKWANGSPVTGEDVAFTYKAMFNPKVPSPYKGYLDFIREVEVDPENSRKFSIITDRAYMRAEYQTAFYVFPAYLFDPEGLMKDFKLSDLTDPEKSKTLAEDEKIQKFATQFSSPEYSRDPSKLQGSGPYLLEAWQEGQSLRLRKKENWWGDALSSTRSNLTAHPDELIYQILPDDVAALSLLKSGELDVMSTIPVDQFNEMRNNPAVAENYQFFTPWTTSYNYYGLNTKNPKLSDKRVRQALAHLVDVQEIIKTVKFGLGKPQSGPLPMTVDEHHEALGAVAFDVEKAKTLLADAGWKDSDGNGIVDKVLNGKKTDLSIKVMVTPRNFTSNKMALIFKNNAQRAGVEIIIDAKEANVLRESLRKRDFDIFAAAAGPDLDLYDPYQFWHTSSDNPSGANRFGFGNQKTDELIEKLRETLDPEERKKLFYEFQEILREEMPAIFLDNAQERIAVHKRFTNVNPSPKSPNYFEQYFKLKEQ